MNITPTERDYLIEFIIEEFQRSEAALEEQKKKNSRSIL